MSASGSGAETPESPETPGRGEADVAVGTPAGRRLRRLRPGAAAERPGPESPLVVGRWARRRRGAALRRLPAAVEHLPGRLRPGQPRPAGVGHAARQPAAARLGAVGRVVLHHRAAAVHAAGADRWPEHRRVPRRGGDDLHAHPAARRDAGPRARDRPPRRRPGADRRRDHARPAARVRGVHPAADRGAHRHVGPAAGDLAGAGPGAPAVAAGRGGRDPAHLGRGRRLTGPGPGLRAGRARLCAAPHPGPAVTESPPVRALPRRRRGGGRGRLPGHRAADPRPGRLHPARGHVHDRAGQQVGGAGGRHLARAAVAVRRGLPGPAAGPRPGLRRRAPGRGGAGRGRADPGGRALLHHGDAGRTGARRSPSPSTSCCT